jgi:hypothetical protein
MENFPFIKDMTDKFEYTDLFRSNMGLVQTNSDMVIPSGRDGRE